LFTTRALRKDDVIGWCNGIFVYRDLNAGNPNPGRWYGRGGFSCSVERYKRYAMEIDTSWAQVEQLAGKRMFVVPPKYCSAVLINDPRTLPGDNLMDVKTANVQFREDPFTTKEDMTRPGIIQIVAIQDVSVGEEIFVNYGNEYAQWV
jgi:hypothetical protein